MAWNPPELVARLLCDITAAATASLAISPLVAVADASVVQFAASHREKRMRSLLWANLKPLFRNPTKFINSRTTKLLFAVYFGTYTSANTIDSIQELFPTETYAYISPTAVKLLGVSAVSTSLTVYKDSCLTQMFGTMVKHPVPRTSYLLFTLRDAITIYGCFVTPPLLAQRLNDLPPTFKGNLSLETFEARTRVSQLLLPVLVQFVTTPIHLLALDLYNRQQRSLGASARMARVKRDLPQAVPTRMLRILPAFGIGGLLNTEMRRATLLKFGLGYIRAS